MAPTKKKSLKASSSVSSKLLSPFFITHKAFSCYSFSMETQYLSDTLIDIASALYALTLLNTLTSLDLKEMYMTGLGGREYANPKMVIEK